MTVPEGNVNSADTLIIPLTTFIKKIKYDSRFNASDVILILIGSIFLYIIFNSANRHDYNRIEILGWSIICYTILAVFIIAKIHFSKKALYLYESGPTAIKLDSEGFEFPVRLLMNNYTRDSLLNTGRFTIKLAWEDITSFIVFYPTRYHYSHYAIEIKNAIPTPGGDYVNTNFFTIPRCFSKKEEKSLLDFAQRFISVNIKKPWF